MKKFLRIGSYIVMLAVFSVALSGCGKTASTNPNAQNVIVWSFEDEDVWKPIAEQFASANKGYTLVYQKQVFDSTYENRVLNSTLSGAGPDVWAMPNDWVFRHKDKLTPMPDTMVKTIKLDTAYVPAVKQSVFFDNKIYALTPSAEPLMVYYNQKLLDKALDNFNETATSKDQAYRTRILNLFSEIPSTWTDFIELTKLITQKDAKGNITISGAALGTDKIANSQDILYLLMLQNQTKITSEDVKLATFNLPKETPRDTTDIPGQRALDFYTSFADPASANYSWNSSLGNELDAFASGQVAMIFGYSSLQNTLNQKYPNFAYKRGSIPQLTTEPATFVDYAKFNAFGVSNLSINPTQSWNLVQMLATTADTDYNSALHLYTSKKSPSYDISADNRNTNNPEKLELATAQSLVKGRYPVDFDSIIRDAIFAVNNKVQDSKSALDLAANNITELLRKTTW